MNAASKIQFVDLPRQYQHYKGELLRAVEEVLERGDFILGGAVGKFEKEFARYCGVKHAVGTSSGLTALELSLKALGIGPGDEVLLPPNTFIATALAVSRTGAKPVFADVDERTQLLDAKLAEKAITRRTKALLPVHLFGQMADMEALGAVAARRGLIVVEDACQAHGAEQKEKRAGSYGAAAAFSFYPGKNLGAFGDAGMAVTNDATLAESLRRFRNVGSTVKYQHPVKGDNARLDTLQAAVLLVKLRHLDEWNTRRREIAALYSKELAGVGDLVLPAIARGNVPVWHLYVIRTKRRDDLARHLADKGVPTVIHYPVPIHLQGAYNDLGLKPGSFPVAERLAREILSLPIHPELCDEDARFVCAQVKAFFAAL